MTVEQEVQATNHTVAYRVLGLDLAHTSTGVAYPNGDCDVWSPPGDVLGSYRLAWFRRAVTNISKDDLPDLAVIEGYSYGTTNNAHHSGELGGVVRLALWDYSVPTAVIAPGTLKKFATDNGHANKDAMLAAAIRHGYQGDDNNEADAWWLRHMGLYHLGVPEVPITQYRTEAVRRVQWPALLDSAAVRDVS